MVRKWESKSHQKLNNYYIKNLNIGELFLILHIHKLFNLTIKQDFPKPWTQSLIVPIFKSGDKKNPFKYRTIVIDPFLAKLYMIILEIKSMCG